MPFATVTELGDYLGFALHPEDTDRATILLAGATAQIQDYTRQTISEVAGDVATLRGTWRPVLILPERPVTTVTSVVVDGEAQTVDTDYVVVRDELRRPNAEYHNWQVPSSDFYPFTKTGWGGPSIEVVVTYTHGFATIPDSIRGVCLQLASRAFMNPEAAAMKVIDGQTVQYGGRPLDLTAGEKDTLNKYRRRLLAASTW